MQHTPEQRQQILHQQQQRLLYLRHASKCQHVDGRCPQGYPNCKGRKELLKHIAACREQRCQYPHCVSSRYVLSHYHKCKDEQCPVCGPGACVNGCVCVFWCVCVLMNDDGKEGRTEH